MAKITLADGMTIEGTAEELRELAKAFGEVAEATEEGKSYDHLIGKYVVFHERKGTIKVGEYYEITEIIDDDGDFYAKYNIEGDHGGDVAYPPSKSRFKYEIVDEKPEEAPKYIEGAPQVGDKILVVDADNTFGDYENGDILTVIKVRSDGSIDFDEKSIYVDREEFVIVERAGEEATEETIEEGDLIRFTENFFGGKEGEIVEVVTGADIDGDIKYRDRDGGIWYAMPKMFELVAKKADRRDLADRKDV